MNRVSLAHRTGLPYSLTYGPVLLEPEKEAVSLRQLTLGPVVFSFLKRPQRSTMDVDYSFYVFGDEITGLA